MYNTLTIKSDILSIGSWSFAPIYFRDLVRKGYKAHERFRVFDKKQELEVGLFSKNEEYYLAIIDPYNNDTYKMKKYDKSSLLPEIRYIDRDIVMELKNEVGKNCEGLDDNNFSLAGNSNFKNKLEIMLLGVNLKYLSLFFVIFCSICIIGNILFW